MIDKNATLKQQIAKVLLITQLFSPMGIKFTTKSYKNFASSCINLTNNFIIDKTNPFKEYSSILEKANHEEKIEKLLKAVEINANISIKEKKLIESIRCFLKDNPYIDFKTLYNMLGKLDIYEQEMKNDNFLMATISEYYVEENYNQKEHVINEDLTLLEIPREKIVKSNIIINSNSNLKDNGFLSSFFHELVHLTGNFSTVTNNGNRIGVGLTEGLTSLIEYDYFENQEENGYFFVRTCAKLIAEIIGEDKLLECHSNYDLVSLILAFEDKGIDNSEVVELILNLDKIVSLEAISKVDEETNMNVINFFKNYEDKIEEGPKSFIYSSLLNDLDCYIKGNYYMSENSVVKFYYNSKKKNNLPYYIEKVHFYEELEYLNERFNIEVLSPTFENKDEVKDVMVKVYIDEKFKTLDEENKGNIL